MGRGKGMSNSNYGRNSHWDTNQRMTNQQQGFDGYYDYSSYYGGPQSMMDVHNGYAYGGTSGMVDYYYGYSPYGGTSRVVEYHSDSVPYGGASGMMDYHNDYYEGTCWASDDYNDYAPYGGTSRDTGGSNGGPSRATDSRGGYSRQGGQQRKKEDPKKDNKMPPFDPQQKMMEIISGINERYYNPSPSQRGMYQQQGMLGHSAFPPANMSQNNPNWKKKKPYRVVAQKRHRI